MGAGGAQGHPAFDNQHEDLIFVRLADAGAGLKTCPAAVGIHHDGAVDDEGGLELHGVGGVLAHRVAGVLDVEEVILMELDALIAPAHVGVAVGSAVTHGVAGQDAAVAVAVGIDEAAAGDGENAIVVFSDGADVFTGDAQLAGGIYAQPAGILGNGQHAQVARAGDAHQQHLIFGVDGQHLLAVDGLNGGAAVIQTGLVDVKVVPAVGERLGMLGEI